MSDPTGTTVEQALQDWRDGVHVEAPPGFAAAARDRARARTRRARLLQAGAGLAVLAVAGSALVVQGRDGTDSLRPVAPASTSYPSDAELAAGQVLFTRTVSESTDSAQAREYTVGERTYPRVDDVREVSEDWAVRGGTFRSVRNGEPLTFDPPTETGARLGAEPQSWDQLAELTTDPRALRARFYAAEGNTPIDTPDLARHAAVAAFMTSSLANRPLPLAQRKAVEQAVASTPGARDDGQQADVLGRPCRLITFPAGGYADCFGADGALLQSESRDARGQLFRRTVLLALGLVGSDEQVLPSDGDPRPLPRPSRQVQQPGLPAPPD